MLENLANSSCLRLVGADSNYANSKGRSQGVLQRVSHRGNRLVNERSGRAEDFRCLYHAWTYDLDGN